MYTVNYFLINGDMKTQKNRSKCANGDFAGDNQKCYSVVDISAGGWRFVRVARTNLVPFIIKNCKANNREKMLKSNMIT